jgi:mono/diheme cytochrome c family protein
MSSSIWTFSPSIEDAESTTTIFDDRRVQRPPVPGTIARGDLEYSDSYYLGYDPDEEVAQLDTAPDWRLVSYLQQRDGQLSSPAEGTPPTPQSAGSDSSESDGDSTQPTAEQPVESGDEPANSVDEINEQQTAESNEQATEAEQAAGEQGDASQAAGEDEVQRAWITKFPLPVDDKLYELGKQKFEQNCSVCHGYAGYGDGLVHQRAAALAQGYWLQPSSLHEERIQEQPVGQIYYTITNGKGKMGGYEASITPKERWAIVLYVRALQRSQNAKPSDVPEEALADNTTQSAAGSE